MPLRPMGREQMWMLPPTLDELLPLDHPARFVAEFVDALDREDWGELGVEIDGEVLGAPAYHPRALLSVWLYGFMTGVRSCRKLEAACRDQIPCLWLTGWQHPDHNTLWRFYRGHRQAMRKLFERTVRTAVTMKLVDLAVQAVDGTKVVANASLNRSYDAEGLRGLLERLESAITDLEAQNEAGEDTAHDGCRDICLACVLSKVVVAREWSLRASGLAYELGDCHTGHERIDPGSSPCQAPARTRHVGLAPVGTSPAARLDGEGLGPLPRYTEAGACHT